jgi:hypothetical protein
MGSTSWYPKESNERGQAMQTTLSLPRNGPTGLLSDSGTNQYTTAFSVDTVLPFRCLVTKITKTQAVQKRQNVCHPTRAHGHHFVSHNDAPPGKVSALLPHVH